MHWDFFNLSNGPLILIAALAIFSLIPVSPPRLRLAPAALAWAAQIAARHFEFSIYDQYMLVIAVFFGVFYSLPQSK